MLWFVLHKKCMSVFTLHKVLQRYNSHPKWSNTIKKQYRWSISSYCLWSRDPFTHMKPVVLRGCVVVLVVCVPLVLLIYLFSIYYVCVFFSVVVVVVVVVLYCCYCRLCAYYFHFLREGDDFCWFVCKCCSLLLAMKYRWIYIFYSLNEFPPLMQLWSIHGVRNYVVHIT